MPGRRKNSSTGKQQKKSAVKGEKKIAPAKKKTSRKKTSRKKTSAKEAPPIRRKPMFASPASRLQFEQLANKLSIGILYVSPKGEILLANETAMRVLGVSRKELIGRTIVDPDWRTLHEDGSALDVEERPTTRAIRTAKPVRGVIEAVTLPGTNEIRWMMVNVEPILAQSGKLAYVISTFSDITERKQMEEDLRESEQRFRTLQEASYGGIAMHDKGMILDCNQGLSEITGFSYEELVGMNGLTLIAPEYVDKVYQNIVNGYDKPYDVEGLRKDGSRYFLEIRGKNIPYKGKTIRVTEFRNITEHKQSTEKILEQNSRLLAVAEDLRRKNEQLEEFTQIVSHNLRSPVGNIVTLLSFLEASETDEEKIEYTRLLKESSATTLMMLDDLSEVLKIRQNKNIETQDISFAEIFRHVNTMLNAKLTESEANVVGDFDEAPMIHYSRIYLESIFLNLLSNALKYCSPFRKITITFKTYMKHGHVILSISDNGLGIDLKRYGHQVFKLRKTFHKHPESRGIGLFMIKNQVEAMGGEITISSIENQGTTFFINFSKHQSDVL